MLKRKLAIVPILALLIILVALININILANINVADAAPAYIQQERSPGASQATSLITTALSITGTWTDLGSEITTGGYETLGLWLNVDVNDSQNVRVRVLAKHTPSGADEYSLPISTVGTSNIKVEPEYTELNVDADQKLILFTGLSKVVPLAQVQVMAGTVGTTTGVISSAYVTKNF